MYYSVPANLQGRREIIKVICCNIFSKSKFYRHMRHNWHLLKTFPFSSLYCCPNLYIFVLMGPDNMDFRLNTVFIFNVIAWDYNKLCVDCRYTKRYYLLTCMVNKRPMGHIAYLRNQYQSIDTFAQSYDYSITFRRVATHTHVRAHRMRENPPKLSSINRIRLIHTKLES